VSRPLREDIWLTMAYELSQAATCVRRKVACILVSADNLVLSTGYNGPHSGAPHCIDTPCKGAFAKSGTALDLCEAIHAEANALMTCRDVREIHTCYVTTSPCIHCTKMLLRSGCQRIVFYENYPHDEARELWERYGREWFSYMPARVAQKLREEEAQP
jgi:dCMP deaminase